MTARPGDRGVASPSLVTEAMAGLFDRQANVGLLIVAPVDASPTVSCVAAAPAGACPAFMCTVSHGPVAIAALWPRSARTVAVTLVLPADTQNATPVGFRSGSLVTTTVSSSESNLHSPSYLSVISGPFAESSWTVQAKRSIDRKRTRLNSS